MSISLHMDATSKPDLLTSLFKMYLFTMTFLCFNCFNVTAGSFNVSLMHSYDVLKEQIEVFCRKGYFCSCVWRVL